MRLPSFADPYQIPLRRRATYQCAVPRFCVTVNLRVPKGVGIVGRTAPAVISSEKAYIQARAEFGTNELDSVKQFGADLIRFQVSQGGNDPQSSIYSPDYLKEVLAAVKMARNEGFTVIVCLDLQAPSGLDEMGMPNTKAQRAWKSLAPLFANDKGVMLELFNEPAPDGPDTIRPYDWNSWRATTQPLVDQVRRSGGKNVLIVDGLNYGHVLNGAPILSDPLRTNCVRYPPTVASDFPYRTRLGPRNLAILLLAMLWSQQNGLSTLAVQTVTVNFQALLCEC